MKWRPTGETQDEKSTPHRRACDCRPLERIGRVRPESAAAANPPARTKPKLTRVPQIAAEPTADFPSRGGTGFDTRSAFSGASPSQVSASATNLSPPVTISYSGSSSALLINATGTGKGAEVHINNANNSASALFGQTNGSGAGLTGYNGGPVGPAGKFGIINDASFLPGVWASTTGGGEANAAALLGQNNSSGGYGTGVEGQRGDYSMQAAFILPDDEGSGRPALRAARRMAARGLIV